jgi:signal peptidase II
MISRKARAFWPLLFLLVFTDCATKRLAETLPVHSPREVVGDVLRFTLAYNPGAAFGFVVGTAEASLWFFGLVAIGMTALFFHWYVQADAGDRPFAIALALVAGGALGNLLDRLRSERGGVDFIDIGLGDVRFWTFNVADAGLTAGAIILAILLWKREAEAEAAQAGVAGGVEVGGELVAVAASDAPAPGEHR